jgi:hypothetical protein
MRARIFAGVIEQSPHQLWHEAAKITKEGIIPSFQASVKIKWQLRGETTDWNRQLKARQQLKRGFARRDSWEKAGAR